MARQFAAKGRDLALCARRVDNLDELKAELTARHPGITVATAALDVNDHEQVPKVFNELSDELGGIDCVIVNAGIGKGYPLGGGKLWANKATIETNLVAALVQTETALEMFRAAGAGHLVLVSSVLGNVGVPGFKAAYSASKAAVEAIGNTFRQEVKPSGAKVGVAYYSELATDMTSRGFDTVAGKKLTGGGTVSGVAPVEAGLRALERGIARRSRRIAAPGWVPPVVPLRHVAQRVIELKPMPDLEESLEIARSEQVAYTTEQPTGTTRTLGS